MLKITTNDPNKVTKLVNIFRYLKNVVTDINLIFSKKGLYFQGMDDSHVSLIELSLDRGWFNTFSIGLDENDNTNNAENGVSLGVNCEMIFTIMNFWTEGYNMEIFTEKPDKLSFKFSGEKKITRLYEIPLMNIEHELIDIPNNDADALIIIGSTEFKTMVNELATFGDTIIIKNVDDEETYLVLESSGELGAIKIKIKEGDIIEYTEKQPGYFRLGYGTKFIITSCDFHKISDEINLHICNKNNPLKLEYLLGGNKDNYLRLFVAPKIDID
jgi:proliferating cell nuclear antigen PCNA